LGPLNLYRHTLNVLTSGLDCKHLNSNVAELKVYMVMVLNKELSQLNKELSQLNKELSQLNKERTRVGKLINELNSIYWGSGYYMPRSLHLEANRWDPSCLLTKV